MKVLNFVCSLGIFLFMCCLAAFIYFGGLSVAGWLIPFLAIVCLAAWLVVALLASQKKSEKRSELMEKYAAKNGWGFNLFPARNSLRILDDVCFYLGERYGVQNFMTGNYYNREIAIFDLYSDSAGTTANFYYTVFGVRAKDLNLPVFYLRPNSNRLLSLKEAFDIDIPHRAEFSRKYLLFSQNSAPADFSAVTNQHTEQAVRALFNDEVCAFFENDNSGLGVAGGGNYLFVYLYSVDTAEFTPPEDFHKYLSYLLNVEQLFRAANQNMPGNFPPVAARQTR